MDLRACFAVLDLWACFAFLCAEVLSCHAHFLADRTGKEACLCPLALLTPSSTLHVLWHSHNWVQWMPALPRVGFLLCLLVTDPTQWTSPLLLVLSCAYTDSAQLQQTIFLWLNLFCVSTDRHVILVLGLLLCRSASRCLVRHHCCWLVCRAPHHLVLICFLQEIQEGTCSFSSATRCHTIWWVQVIFDCITLLYWWLKMHAHTGMILFLGVD